MINGVTRWLHECGHITFPGTSHNLCNFLVEMSTFKVEFWMQQIWQKGSAKFTDQNTFLEKLRDQVDKIIGKLYLSKSIPNVCLKFIWCQEACKLYLLMNNWNLRLQVWECQNASNETWIRAAKLFKNIQSALNIWIKCRPNFHKVECTGGNFTNPC